MATAIHSRAIWKRPFANLRVGREFGQSHAVTCVVLRFAVGCHGGRSASVSRECARRSRAASQRVPAASGCVAIWVLLLASVSEKYPCPRL
jgi:hypothetical protein